MTAESDSRPRIGGKCEETIGRALSDKNISRALQESSHTDPEEYEKPAKFVALTLGVMSVQAGDTGVEAQNSL